MARYHGIVWLVRESAADLIDDPDSCPKTLKELWNLFDKDLENP
jgi:hypothetical protein